MTNPSHLKVRYLFELPELPPGEVENSWTYTYVPNGPDKDYKVFLPTLIEEAVDDVSADILQAAADYTDQETDQIRQDLLDAADGLGTDMVAYRSDALGAAARPLRHKLDDIISVKDFGAVGDGVSLNEAAAINTALQYLKSKGGGTLYIPAGVYLLTSGIFVPSNCTLQGAGIDATILRAVDPFPVRHNLITNESNNQLPRTDPDVNIHIADMTLDGNFMNRNTAGTANDNGCGIRLACVHNCTIKRVKSCYNVLHNIDISSSVNPNDVDNPPGGPNAPGPSMYVSVEDCEAHTPLRDDNFTVHGSGFVIFSRCYAWFDHATHPGIGSSQHGIEFDDGAFDCAARDCYVEDVNDGFQVKGHDGIICARSIVIERCYAKNCTRALNLERNSPFDGRDVTVRDFTVDGLATHGATALACVRIYGYSNVLIDGLRVLNVNNSDSAVRISQSASDIVVRNITTRNSSFDASGNNAVVYVLSAGPPQNITVENVFCETPIDGMVVRFSSGNSFGSVRNINATSSTGLEPAIYVAGGGTARWVNVSEVNVTNFAGQLSGAAGGGWAIPDGVQFEWKRGCILIGSGTMDPNGNVPGGSGSVFLRDGVGMYVREASGIGTAWVAK